MGHLNFREKYEILFYTIIRNRQELSIIMTQVKYYFHSTFDFSSLRYSHIGVRGGWGARPCLPLPPGGGGGTQWFRRGCAAEAAKPVPII